MNDKSKNPRNEAAAEGDDGEAETGTPDSTYALISTAYHLLQGAETLGMFIDDANEDGQEEVAEFLEETRDESWSAPNARRCSSRNASRREARRKRRNEIAGSRQWVVGSG